MLCPLALVFGCGGGQQKQQVATVAVVVSPQSAVVTSGQTVQFTATVTGDNSGVVWSVKGVTGGNSTVGTIDSTGKFTAPMVTQKATATVAATSKGDPTKSASSIVTINPPAVVAVAVSPQSVIVGADAVTQFTATVTGANSGVTWSVNGIAGGNATVGAIDSMGNYTAPAVAQNATATVSAASNVDPTKSATGSVTIVAPGVVTATANVQVAMYTITPPVSANVSIQFGRDTTYGLNTWEQPSPSGGGAVTILVAGMKLNSTYHMRAILKFADGSEFDDVDQKFTTGNLPAASVPNVVATTSPGATPQSGVELLDLVGIAEPSLGAVVTDLGGNVLWAYNPHCPEVPKLTQLSCCQTGTSWSVCRHNQTAQVRLFRKLTCPGKSFGN